MSDPDLEPKDVDIDTLWRPDGRKMIARVGAFE